MSFPYPRILDVVINGDWCITPGAYRSILTALENVASHGIQERAGLLDGDERGGNQLSKVGNIGIVSIAGIIGKRISSLDAACGGVDVNAIVSDVRGMAADPGIDTVIMDWNSPGGTVTGVPEAYEALYAVSKKVNLISYTDTQQCSAAQWLSSAASSQYAAASSTVGSVGVYNLVLDRSEQLAQEGIKVEAISAGKHKLLGAQFQPLSAEHRSMLQGRVDAIHADFKKAVKRGRKVDDSALEGQGLTGTEGVKAGMIDGIYPSLESLISALQKMGGQK